MEVLKKILTTIFEIVLILGFCGAVIFFLFPNMFGKKKPETEATSEVVIGQKIYGTTEAYSETEEKTEAVTEVTTEATTEAVTEATTEKKAEATTEKKTEKKNGDEDTEAPFFMIFRSSPVITQGEIFNIHDYVGYADDVDRDVDLSMIGTVDESHTGTYALKVTLKDDAGHTTSKDMEVKVIEKPSSDDSEDTENTDNTDDKQKEENDHNTESFEDFKKAYKTDKTSVGIDISRFQEYVDFEKVKEAGCEFVIMRIGGFDRGTYYTDKYYYDNMARAKAAGLKVGVYWHAEDSSVDDVNASVRYLMEILDDTELDFPIAYDWEDFENFENYGMNLKDINMCFEAFANSVEARGYQACLYSSLNFLENTWKNEEDHAVWLAHYTTSTTYDGDYYMWQHANTGRINGVDGDVDLNVLYKDAY